MSLTERFNEAADKVKKFKKRPEDKELLEIYALYKQATVGDCATERPTGLEASVKWEAWKSRHGIEPDIAKQLYIDTADALEKDYGS